MSEKEEVRKRVPFGGPRQRLSVDAEFPGFKCRWFNDQDGRLQRARDAGYEFVLKKEVGQVGDKDIANGNTNLNSYVSKVVGRTRAEQPIVSYYMKIRESFYKEDQAKKEETNRLVDDAVRAGKAGGAAVENQYGGVTLK